MKFLQCGILYFINAFDLPDEKFRIADHLERFVTIFSRIFKRGDQALVLGDVIGLVSQVFAQRRHFLSGLVLNYDSISRWTGIPSRSPVAVSDQIMCGS